MHLFRSHFCLLCDAHTHTEQMAYFCSSTDRAAVIAGFAMHHYHYRTLNQYPMLFQVSAANERQKARATVALHPINDFTQRYGLCPERQFNLSSRGEMHRIQKPGLHNVVMLQLTVDAFATCQHNQARDFDQLTTTTRRTPVFQCLPEVCLFARSSWSFGFVFGWFCFRKRILPWNKTWNVEKCFPLHQG